MGETKQDIILKEKGAKKAESSIGGIDKQLMKIAGSAVSVAAAMAGAKKAMDLGEQAAVFDVVRKKFEQLAEQPGAMLIKMKKMTAGTIDEMTLMQKYNAAALLGLPLERFDDMLGIARGAAQATGESMDYMLNSIVTALGRGSKLMLDNLGIMIDVKQANEEYAAALGITADKLTDAEKKQAFIDKALEIGNENLERMGGVTAAATDKYDKMRASIKEAAISLGGYLSPATEGVAGWFSSAASAAGDFFKRASETSLETTIREMKELGLETAKYELLMARVEAARLERLAASLGTADEAQERYQERLEETKTAVNTLGEAQTAVIEEWGSELQNRISDDQPVLETLRVIVGSYMAAATAAGTMATAEEERAMAALSNLEMFEQAAKVARDNLSIAQEEVTLVAQKEAALREVAALEEMIARGDSGQDEEIEKTKELTDAEKSRLYQLALALNGVQALTMETENFGIASINTYENLNTYEQDSIDRQGDYTTSFGERTASVIALTHRVTLAAQGDMNAIASQWKEGAVLAKRVAQFNVLLNAKEAIVAAYKSAATVPYIGFLLAPAAAAAAAAATWAQVRSIEAQSFAMGGSFQTSGRRLIDVGDNYGGREQVDITPISSPNYAGPKTGRAASEVHFHNPIMTRDFIREEVHEELQRLERLNA